MTGSHRSSIICPNCRKLISVSETTCPYCGMKRPGSVWKNNFWTRVFNDPLRLVKIVIGVNAGMFLLSLVISSGSPAIGINPLTMLSPSNESLFYLGATGTIPIQQYHRWWTLLAAGYLHGGILHIFFNMAAFWQLATIVVRDYGVYRMFIIYTLGGIIGFAVSYLAGLYVVNIPLTIGASASVCGLVGSILYYGKSRGGTYGMALYKQVSLWVVFLFIFGLLVPGINNWGHGGGILAGICLGYLLGYNEKRRESWNHKLLAAICAVATVLTLAWAVFSGLVVRLLA